MGYGNRMTTSRLLYGILITVAVGAALGRLMSTQLVLEPSLHRDEQNPKDTRRHWPSVRPPEMPTFSSNDRSRWATVRALVDEGTYVIGRRSRPRDIAGAVGMVNDGAPVAIMAAQAACVVEFSGDHGIIFEDGWQSLDKVLRPDTLEFYSSKPPLLSTLIAGLYWLLEKLLGWTLTTHPAAVVRTILVVVNIVPLVIYLHLIARLADSFGRTEWGRVFVVAAAAFATLVSPFVITLNNHTIATYFVLFTLACVVAIWRRVPRGRGGLAEGSEILPARYFVAAGLLASFAVCNELPALAFAAAVFVLLLYWAPRRTLILFLPGAAVPAIAFFATNYAAIGQMRPAYSEFGGPWYEYAGSYWIAPPSGQVRRGIDFAYTQESRGEYTANLLIGHHGWFSLTPIWLLALVAMIGGALFGAKRLRQARLPDPRGPPPGLPWFLPPLAFGVSAVVIGFYAVKSNNYGGFSNGLRWLMWLTPLWLLCLLPAADWLGRWKWGRTLAYLCLGISVLSANYSPWNPWRHPWLYDLLVALGWPGY